MFTPQDSILMYHLLCVNILPAMCKLFKIKYIKYAGKIRPYNIRIQMEYTSSGSLNSYRRFLPPVSEGKFHPPQNSEHYHPIIK